ncbi:MAG: DUF2085 domain-containing protein [Anaerolineae bacterium]|nr:DUF2085 domain-containing protein [Anaerolineae bacterium]
MDKQQKVHLAKAAHWTFQHWLALFIVLFGLFNLLPFLAPVAAKFGFSPAADAIYTMYAPLCHQMAQRSFFLFGDQLMYDPQQLPLGLTDNLTANMLALKGFDGNAAIGWKVAWSDRMVYMYGATWFAAVIYAVASRHRRVKRLSIGLFILLMLPMAVDGITHMLSDLSTGGLFAGFRYSNDWLAGLTANALPAWFYTGDGLGSFNAWMRLVSGLGFGIALVGLVFPLLEQEMQRSRQMLAAKLRHHNERQVFGSHPL